MFGPRHHVERKGRVQGLNKQGSRSSAERGRRGERPAAGGLTGTAGGREGLRNVCNFTAAKERGNNELGASLSSQTHKGRFAGGKGALCCSTCALTGPAPPPWQRGWTPAGRRANPRRLPGSRRGRPRSPEPKRGSPFPAGPVRRCSIPLPAWRGAVSPGPVGTHFPHPGGGVGPHGEAKPRGARGAGAERRGPQEGQEEEEGLARPRGSGDGGRAERPRHGGDGSGSPPQPPGVLLQLEGAAGGEGNRGDWPRASRSHPPGVWAGEGARGGPGPCYPSPNAVPGGM